MKFNNIYNVLRVRADFIGQSTYTNKASTASEELVQTSWSLVFHALLKWVCIVSIEYADKDMYEVNSIGRNYLAWQIFVTSDYGLCDKSEKNIQVSSD